MVFMKIVHGLLLLPPFFHTLKEEDQIKVSEQERSPLSSLQPTIQFI